MVLYHLIYISLAILITSTHAEDACWIRMPTGCANRLSEQGSDGHGTVWFQDPHTSDEQGCIDRIAAYSPFCARDDIRAHWGTVSDDICWIKMPSGCDQDLSDKYGYEENIWFQDYEIGQEHTESTCADRVAEYNGYCYKDDAEYAWGGLDLNYELQPWEQCWVIAPTGCNNALTEPGAEDPTTFFPDPWAFDEGACKARYPVYNSYCGRNDVRAHWGLRTGKICWIKLPTGCDETPAQYGYGEDVWFEDYSDWSGDPKTEDACMERIPEFDGWCTRDNTEGLWLGIDYPVACDPTEVPHSNYATANSMTGYVGESVNVTCDPGYLGSNQSFCEDGGHFTEVHCTLNFTNNNSNESGESDQSESFSGSSAEVAETSAFLFWSSANPSPNPCTFILISIALLGHMTSSY